MKISILVVFISCFAFVGAAIADDPPNDPSNDPPNVVIVFADDLGYGDLGCYGATKVQTPNIDRLASQGRRFTDAHSCSAVCTPSRYGLMTGHYPSLAKGGKGIWGPAGIESELLIDTDKTTIADVFQRKDYDTAALGKWHLGFKEGKNDWELPLSPGPNDLGFDYFFGVPLVNSAPPYVFVENTEVYAGEAGDPLKYLGRKPAKGAATPLTPIPVTSENPKHGSNRVRNMFSGAAKAHEAYNDFEVGTMLAEKSVQWIKQRNGKPFFLYLSPTNIHHPFTPAKRFQGTSQCGLYGDSIHELDWMVGEILNCLEEQGMADNTLIIFTSDNGGMFNNGGQTAFKHGHKQNGDLLGSKFGIWEGGHRVPMIACWPKRIKAGSVSSQLICNVDFLATFAALTDFELSDQHRANSENMLPALLGDPDGQLREQLLLSPRKSSHLGLRMGKWMYIPKQGHGGFPGKEPGHHAFGGSTAANFMGKENSDIVDGKIRKSAPSAQLYDLVADPNQTRNLCREYPEVVESMAAELKRYRAVK